MVFGGRSLTPGDNGRMMQLPPPEDEEPSHASNRGDGSSISGQLSLFSEVPLLDGSGWATWIDELYVALGNGGSPL